MLLHKLLCSVLGCINQEGSSDSSLAGSLCLHGKIIHILHFQQRKAQQLHFDWMNSLNIESGYKKMFDGQSNLKH